jgi:hypothetical protein
LRGQAGSPDNDEYRSFGQMSCMARYGLHTVRPIRQKFALLIPKANFDDARPVRFQGLSASIGRLLYSTSPHSHSIVLRHRNALIYQRKSFPLTASTDSLIRQKFALLIPNRNFKHSRFARFQRLSSPIGRFFSPGRRPSGTSASQKKTVTRPPISRVHRGDRHRTSRSAPSRRPLSGLKPPPG